MLNSCDTAFVLICSALVFIMTPGLAFFYGGLVRNKNVLSLMMQNFIAMGMVTVIWAVIGFSLIFGHDVDGIIGGLDYLLMNNIGINSIYPGTGIPVWTFFIFQLMFAVITPGLITGAFVDRFKFSSYLIFMSLWSVLVYSVIAHWIWGGGILAKLGAIDFAGGTAVHISAGMAALATAMFIGKRRLGEAQPHNITYVALGAGLLWFGWFGFNGGSALSANFIASIAFVNTTLAASVAMLVWLFISWTQKGKPSLIGALTGAIAGLVAITPAAGYVTPKAAMIIGIVAGVVCYFAMVFKIKREWDDALDVWACHGVGGIVGSILTGVFASPEVNSYTGLVFGGYELFKANLIATVVAAGYSFGVTYLILFVLSKFMDIRVEKEVEEQGLDFHLHGEQAYNLDW
ncbi:MAG: ammonium transporter [Candidatus Schekmanbacteria bacterium]|nr:ammonium transporter [Candidatus Schekmanbacteria bacterium]